jgi:hypothetical protein
VQLPIDPGTPDRPLSYWDTTVHDWTIASGAYGVQIGSSSRTLPLNGSFQVR